MATKIEYVDLTINPFVGCSKCSPACQNCFAERIAARLAKNPKMAAKYAGVVDDKGHWTGKISGLDLSCFDKLPKKPSRVFVGSMTDFFHENADFDDQGKVLAKIAHTPEHTFLLLTKRPERAYRRYHTRLPNVWLGVTVCNQEEADKKIPILLRIPAAKHFVSIEPMLGPVDISKYATFCDACSRKGKTICVGKPGSGEDKCVGLDWVIAGGETGPNARPMHEAWVKSLRDQCLETGTPFFFKSWGEWCPYNQLHTADKLAPRLDSMDKRFVESVEDKESVTIKIGKKRSGHLIDGVEYRQFPEM